jgi:osmotically-inducible protein OsmY
MPRILVYTLLLLGTPLICQQPSQNQNPAIPAAQAQPESGAQTQQSDQPLQDKAAGNERIQNNLQSAFDDDPTLSGADITANVDDEAITLTGAVHSYLQHQRVLQLVSPYYSYRGIVDKVTVQ